MTIITSTRAASIDEIATEMDRRGTVIEGLEATIASLTEQLAAAAAERDAAVRVAGDTTQDLARALARLEPLRERVNNAEGLVDVSDRVIALMARALFQIERLCAGSADPVVAGIASAIVDWRTDVRSSCPPDWGASAMEALVPFADISGEGSEDYPDDMPVMVTYGRVIHHALTLGDLRRAGVVFAAGEARALDAGRADPTAAAP